MPRFLTNCKSEDVEENPFVEEENVVQWIEQRVTSRSAKLRDVIHDFETELKRQLNNMELASVQRKYVQVALDF